MEEIKKRIYATIAAIFILLLALVLLASCSLSRNAQNDKIRLSNVGKVVDISESDNLIYVAIERASVNGVKVIPLDLYLFENAYIGMTIKIIQDEKNNP